MLNIEFDNFSCELVPVSGFQLQDFITETHEKDTLYSRCAVEYTYTDVGSADSASFYMDVTY